MASTPISTWDRIKNNPEAVEKYRRYQREWRAKQRAKQRAAEAAAGKSSKSAIDSRRRRLIQQARDREAVFGHYGMSCVRCGECDPVVLTIDHIDQKGFEHKPGNRKRRISGYVLYRWLVKNGLPAGYRTACANCQIRFYRESKYVIA